MSDNASSAIASLPIHFQWSCGTVLDVLRSKMAISPPQHRGYVRYLESLHANEIGEQVKNVEEQEKEGGHVRKLARSLILDRTQLSGRHLKFLRPRFYRYHSIEMDTQPSMPTTR